MYLPINTREVRAKKKEKEKRRKAVGGDRNERKENRGEKEKKQRNKERREEKHRDREERTESKNKKKEKEKTQGLVSLHRKRRIIAAVAATTASHRQLSNHAPSFQVIFSLYLSLIICSHLHAEREQFTFCRT